jgi:hypothetical protein
MILQTTPKLYPPMALLWEGPMPYQSAGAVSGTAGAGSLLSIDELRSIVSQMVD